MLKKHISYDISDFLIHKKLKLTTPNKFSINEDIIKIIKNSFKEKNDKNNIYSDEYINEINVEKAKELIKFYPKNEKENEENIVKKFIKCYKKISGEKIDEEEIDTINISLWEKTIEILCIELLKIIDKDQKISESLIRMNINQEDELIKNLNLFYSILFKYVKDNKALDLYNFIPNEKKVYKKLNNVFCNKDIDKEIRLILTYLNEYNIFDDILIYYKIKLGIKHQQKSLEDIALEVDKEIKKKFTKIDNLIEIQKKEVKIDENFKIACNQLIRKWFVKHKDKKNLFDFVHSHISDISIKILYDKKFKDIIEEIFIYNSSEDVCRMLNEIQKKNYMEQNIKNEIEKCHSKNSSENMYITQSSINNKNYKTYSNRVMLIIIIKKIIIIISILKIIIIIIIFIMIIKIRKKV